MISGTLTADFGSFYEACRQAQVELRAFESSNRKVERSLDDMVDNFSGRKVITDATLMTEALSRIGSPARLTRNELQQMGAVAEEASEKLRRIGGDVPVKMQAIADAARRARGENTQLVSSLRSFDGVLATLGVNIGPEIRGLEEMANASGKTASQLGGIATAGLVVGAAIGGWKIGRAASEFLDLDEKIAGASARLLGFGDIAAEKAAVRADALAKASKLAGFEVKEMGLALMLNADAAKQSIEANQKLDEQLARQRGPEISRLALEALHKEEEDFRASGVLPDLIRDINSHAFGLDELAKRYRLSTAAMADFNSEAERSERIERSNAEKLNKLTIDFRLAEGEAEKRRKAEAEAKRKADDEAFSAAVEAQNAIHEKDIQLAEAQLAARKATEAQTQALYRQKLAAEAVARAMGNTLEFDLSTKEGQDRFKQFNPTAQVNAAATTDYFKTHTLAEAVAAGLVIFQQQNAVNSRGQLPIVGAGSGTASQGGYGSAGAPQNPFGPPPPVAPESAAAGFGRSGGGGTRVYAPIFVSGVFDPSSSHALQSTVGSGLARAVLNGRLW